MKNLILVLICMFTGAAHAGLINLAPKSESQSGGSIAYSNLVSPTDTFSDALFSLSIAGDFDNNNATESAVVSIEGFSLGRIFDNNAANDLFDFAGDDYVGNHSNMITMTGEATIAQADWATIIADGFVDVYFNFSSGVNCCGAPYAFTSGNIQFDSTPVPAPASLAILALGLAGFGFSRKKKNS